MEKLCFRLIIFFVIPISLFSQEVEKLCVFDLKGDILNKKTGELLLKGDAIIKKDVLIFEDQASMTVIDSNGSAYRNSDGGDCSFYDFLSKKRNLSSLTVRYFKFLYQELIGEKDRQSVMAGVYRGNDLLLMPPDSALVFDRNLKFVWDNPSTNFFYFFLRNKTTKAVLKLGVSGTKIKLYKNMSIFNDSTEFEWTIDTREYPDLENIGWNRFEIVPSDIIQKKKEEYTLIVDDLKDLGWKKLEIKRELCQNFRLCE